MNSQEMNMTAMDPAVDDGKYKHSGEWEIADITTEMDLIQYNCCKVPYSQVKFTLQLQRKTLYYVVNMVLPCCVFSVLSIITFILPPACGERVGVDMTILLALSVFQTIVNANLPPTSDAVPLLGIYYLFVMIICAVSLCITMGVLRLHYYQPDSCQMPDWVQSVICGRLAVFLRVRVPNSVPETGQDIVQPKFRYVNGSDHVTPVENNDVSVTECADDSSVRSTSEVLLNIRDLLGTRRLTPSSPPAPAASASAGSSISSVERLLGSINDLLETRLRSDAQLRLQTDKHQQMHNDWMLAAAVIDRICFIVFSFIFVIGTVVLFVLATVVQH